MAKAKHVKLGEKASVFYDPSSGLKITPGQAVELNNDHKKSMRVVRAIKSGHLDYVHEDELEDLTVVSLNDQKRGSSQTEKKETEKNEENQTQTTNQEQDEDEWDENSLKRLKKPELVKMAKDNGSEYSQDDLEDFNKTELTEEILSLLEKEDGE